MGVGGSVVVTRAWKFEPTIKKKGCPDVAFYSVWKDEFVNKPHETTIDPGAAPSDAKIATGTLCNATRARCHDAETHCVMA